jgi:hypothetical protein
MDFSYLYKQGDGALPSCTQLSRPEIARSGVERVEARPSETALPALRRSTRRRLGPIGWYGMDFSYFYTQVPSPTAPESSFLGFFPEN